MAARALYLLSLALTASLASAAKDLACPAFSCTPIGSNIPGFFQDSSDASDPTSAYVIEAYLLPNYGYYESILTPSEFALEDANVTCAKVCAHFNDGVDPTDTSKYIKYWQYEHTCADSNGGTCTCFNKHACEKAAAWSDESVQGDPNSAVGISTFTTGELCDGGSKGDPHFSGADGSHFDFSGIPNRNFAIISDAHVEVNGYFGGRYGKWGASTKALTWIRQVGIMFGHHTAVFSARTGADAEYHDGYMASVEVDGEALVVPPKGKASAADGAITVEWAGVKVRSGNDLVDMYKVSVGDKLTMRLTARPEVKNLRTAEDAVVHFSLDVLHAELSENAHGVVGQTYRPDFAGRLEKQSLVHSDLLNVDQVPGDNAEGFIDGVVEDYMVSGLLKADCKLCRFTRASSVDAEAAQAIALSTANVGRKFLGSH